MRLANRVSRILFFLSVLLIFFSCAQNRDATPTASTKFRIAYNVHVPDSLHPDNYEVFTMEIDGSDKQNLTRHPDVAWTYLASGDQIYFISDRDTAYRNYFLYAMNFDGSDVRKISDVRLRDSWMDIRNDAELIVSPHPSVDSALYLISTSGQLLQKIVPPVPYFTDPAFSPDGKQIAFRGSNKRSKREPGYEEAIYVSNLDGSDLTRISNYPVQDTTAPWYAYKSGPPRWHPSGAFISYQSMRNGKYSLFAAAPDGSKEWKLTQNQQSEGWHSWSPDGKWLALDIFDVDQSHFDIGLMNWEDQTLRILTDTLYQYQQAPTFLEVPDK